jgi:hypothetical protein
MDVYILRPVDQARGNHKLFFEVNNRGSKLFGAFNGAPPANHPVASTQGGSTCLAHEGHKSAGCGRSVG